jgi:hypothetical protein
MPILILVQDIRRSVESLGTQMTSNAEAHHRDLVEAVGTLLSRSFPNGDAEGHRRFHEASIRAAEDRAKFWNTMRSELAKYGLLGFLGWAIYYLWQAFLQGPHR